MRSRSPRNAVTEHHLRLTRLTLTNSAGGANTTVNWDINGDAINDSICLNRYPDTVPGNYGVIGK